MMELNVMYIVDFVLPSNCYVKNHVWHRLPMCMFCFFWVMVFSIFTFPVGSGYCPSTV